MRKRTKTLKTRFGWLNWGSTPPKTRFGGGVAWEVVPRPQPTYIFLYIFAPIKHISFIYFQPATNTSLLYISPESNTSLLYIFSPATHIYLLYIFSPHQTHIFSTTYLYHTHIFTSHRHIIIALPIPGDMVFKVITRGGVKNRRTHRVPCY